MPSPPWTTEPQREFLQSRFSDYLDAQKNGDYTNFWARLYEDWAGNYPENLVVFPEKSVSDYNPDETETLKTAIKARRQQLQTWFRWRATSRARTATKQPKALGDLFTRSRLPQKAEIYSKLCYDDKIKPIVNNEAENLNVTGRAKLQLSNKITRQMWDAEEDDEIKAKVEERLAELIQKQGLALEPEQRTNEQYMEAIEDCPRFLGGLLNALAERTGWAFSVLMGGPDPSLDGDVTVASFHVGETSAGKRFGHAHPDFEKVYMEPFTEFLLHMYPPALRQSRSLKAKPQNHGVSSDGVEEKVGEDLESFMESDMGALQSAVDALSKSSATTAGDALTGSTPAPVPVTESPSHLVSVTTVGSAVAPVLLTLPPSTLTSPALPVSATDLSFPVAPVPGTLAPAPRTSPAPPQLASQSYLDHPTNPLAPPPATPTSDPPALSSSIAPVPEGTDITFLDRDQELAALLNGLGDNIDGAHVGPDNYQFMTDFAPDFSWMNTFEYPGFNASGVLYPGVEIPGFDVPITPSVPHDGIPSPLPPALPLPDPSAIPLPPLPLTLSPIPSNHHDSPDDAPETQSNCASVVMNAPQLALSTITASENQADASTDASSSAQSRSRSGRHIIPSTRADAMNKIGSFQKLSLESSNKENIPPGTEHERPAWELAAEAHLMTRDLGDGWTKCVNVWIAFEKAMGPNAKGALPSTKSRPAEWTKWVAKGRHGVRAYNATPTIADPLDFGYAVMGWWKSMQPPFRQSSELMPKAVYEPLEPSVASMDEWAALRKGGPNGLVSMLTVLVWWGQCMKTGSQWQESSEPHWRACVDDVRQCLEKMKPEASSRKRVRGAKENESGPTKRAKKAK